MPLKAGAVAEGEVAVAEEGLVVSTTISFEGPSAFGSAGVCAAAQVAMVANATAMQTRVNRVPRGSTEGKLRPVRPGV